MFWNQFSFEYFTKENLLYTFSNQSNQCYCLHFWKPILRWLKATFIEWEFWKFHTHNVLTTFHIQISAFLFIVFFFRSQPRRITNKSSVLSMTYAQRMLIGQEIKLVLKNTAQQAEEVWMESLSGCALAFSKLFLFQGLEVTNAFSGQRSKLVRLHLEQDCIPMRNVTFIYAIIFFIWNVSGACASTASSLSSFRCCACHTKANKCTAQWIFYEYWFVFIGIVYYVLCCTVVTWRFGLDFFFMQCQLTMVNKWSDITWLTGNILHLVFFVIKNYVKFCPSDKNVATLVLRYCLFNFLIMIACRYVNVLLFKKRLKLLKDKCDFQWVK